MDGDHNPGLHDVDAGGGIKPGQYSGYRRDRDAGQSSIPHVHDIHASILHLLGLNHISLTYLHNGRAERPTIGIRRDY